MNIPTEEQEQAAVIKWARIAALSDQRLELLHGDSSGVRVSIGAAMKMKRAGAVKGFPDLFLPVSKASEPGQYHCCGLFIELKRIKNSAVSIEQHDLHERLRNQGYAVFVCRGADAAIRTIKQYLGIGG